MTKTDAMAEIYNLSGSILMGKADKEGVKRVVGIAREHGLMDMLKQEYLEIGAALRKCRSKETP